MNEINDSKDSIEFDEEANEIQNDMDIFNDKENCATMNIPFEKCITLFNAENYVIIKQQLKKKELNKNIRINMKKTPIEQRDNYTNQMINIIKSMNKSNHFQEFPKLPFGKQLSDDEFIELLKKTVFYANYKLDYNRIENLKNRFINDNSAALQNLFHRGRIVKDILENAIITILTTNIETEQEDNFKLLNVENATAAPILNMKFKDKEKYTLNIKELQNIFCSYVYIKKYKKALSIFFNAVPSDDKLKEYIFNYFENHWIYFCDLPQNILAFTIHSGNIYLKGNYLYEYYNEKKEENLLLIREKIILNIGHELMHILMREIDQNMKNNFLIKSNPKNKKIKGSFIEFNDKFTDEIHYFNINESGDVFDYQFFNKYYFGDLYHKEANFFYDIKDIKSIKDYNKKLNDIIQEEKNNNIIPISVNKFKKLKEEHPRRCIRSQYLGIKRKTKEKKDKNETESEDNESYDESD